MSKFEERGLEIQYSCMTAAEARSEFSRSCKCCCRKGLRIECERCSIAYVHNQVLKILEERKVS